MELFEIYRFKEIIMSVMSYLSIEILHNQVEWADI